MLLLSSPLHAWRQPRSHLIRNYLKKARWLCRSIQTESTPTPCLSAFSVCIRCRSKRHQNWKWPCLSGDCCFYSFFFFSFFLSTVPVVIFLSGRLHCVKCCHQGCWGGQHWHWGIVHAKSFLMGDICGMIRAGWDQGDNSVAPFRCDSESFKGSVCHIWDFEEETV